MVWLLSFTTSSIVLLLLFKETQEFWHWPSWGPVPRPGGLPAPPHHILGACPPPVTSWGPAAPRHVLGAAPPPHRPPRPRHGVCGVCPACCELQFVCLCEKPAAALRLRMETNTARPSPAEASPQGPRLCPFGRCFQAAQVTSADSPRLRAHVVGQASEGAGIRGPGSRELPSACPSFRCSGRWVGLRPVFPCRSGGRAPGFSLWCSVRLVF